VIADSLQEEEVYGLQEVFKIIDTDCSGTISLEELRVGLHKFGSLLSDDEVKALMEAVRRPPVTLGHWVPVSLCHCVTVSLCHCVTVPLRKCSAMTRSRRSWKR